MTDIPLALADKLRIIQKCSVRCLPACIASAFHVPRANASFNSSAGATVDFRGLIPMLGFLLLCRRFEQRLVTNWRQVQLNASWQRLYSQTDEAMQVMITELFDLAKDRLALQHMHELCTLHGPGLRVDLAIAVPLAQLWHSFFEVSSIGLNSGCQPCTA